MAPDSLSNPISDSFPHLLESLQETSSGNHAVTIPDSWAQGQTTYGGLTAALALEATQRSLTDLPPLRSAQVSFIGAAGGTVQITPSLIRQGRSMTFAQTDLVAEKGLATRAMFAFGHSRESAFSEFHLPAPDLPEPEDAGAYMRGPLAPVFTQHFDTKLAHGGLPVSGSEHSNHFIWARFKQPTPNSVVSLLALADMPPPAIMPRFTTFKPISSLTWIVNMLDDHPEPFRDGWWLLQSRAEHATQGYSSQDMIIWGKDLQPVVAGRQSVAIYV